MFFERLAEPFDALVIKETFKEKELSNILNEIKPFTEKSQEPDGVWLLDVYKDLEMSATHNNSMETFFSPEVVESLFSVNSMYGLYDSVNNHSTQIKYFGDGQSSLLHYDSAAFTIMTFLFNDPKGFDGGDVTLQIGGDVAYEQEIENNMSIIFPSCYYVGLSEVSTKNKDVDNSGLYVITSYLFIESR
jgi:hypothetical protein